MLTLNPPSRVLPHCLPPPQPSIFWDAELADYEEQLSPAWAGEVNKHLPYQSPPTSPLRVISNKLRSEIKELDVMLCDATKLQISLYHQSNQQEANLPGISADKREDTYGVPAPPPVLPISLFFPLLDKDHPTVASITTTEQSQQLHILSLTLFW